jgi:excisionase family DNA binding protein
LTELDLSSPLLTDDEAAAMLALSVTTLKKWRRLHRGPMYYRLGSAIRYRREDLEAFVARSAGNPWVPRHEGKGDR